jgi:hypothetical protein
MHSLHEAQRRVQGQLARVAECADSADAGFIAFERRLWTELLALGRAVVALFLVRRTARPRAIEYVHDGQRYRLDEVRTTELGTRFGKLPFARRVGRRVGAASAAADLPIDRELGLCGGFSLGVVLAMTRLCAQMAFAPARATFAESYEWTPSPRATLRMVDAVGSAARQFLEAVPAPEGDGEILVLQADGGGAPAITEREHRRRRQRRRRPTSGSARRQRREHRREHPRRRRTKGKKSKNAKVAFVGVIYTLRTTANGVEGPLNKRIYATFESHEALFVWLRREADKRGYGKKRTVFLGDGSEHLWRCKERHLPEAEECIDWYHVVEKLWAGGEALHPEGSPELASWVARQKSRLRRGAALSVIMSLEQHLATIPRSGPGNKGKRVRLVRALRYLREHVHRMRYHVLRDADLDIATGAVEGAVRNLVRMRLDGPGMRWGIDRAEHVLHLRCVLLNGQWAAFSEHIARLDGGVRLAAQPLPARTHDAKAAA